MMATLVAKAKTGLLLTGAVFWGIVSNAAGVPDLVLPAGAGVNIHFSRGHEHDLDLIAAAGFKLIRMDFFWGEIERAKGVYDWSAYDELTANLDRRGLRAYYILDYSNPLYEERVVAQAPISGQMQRVLASPQHSESIEAFARFAAAAAKHFQGRHVIWEIWNEPNLSFWQPKPDVEQYIALALATAKAMRAADPQATIFAPATSGFPWRFLESFLKSGVLEFLDGVSVHPYRPPGQPPETATDDFKKLRGLIAVSAPSRRSNSIPIISGEWGYSSRTKGVSLETQAEFIVRQQLANLWNGVPVSIWYDWKNDGGDPKENEHNFGTVSRDLSPKPAYMAMKIFTRELAGFSIRRRCHTASQDDFVLMMTNAAGETKLAAWTLNKPHQIMFQLQPSAAKAALIVNAGGQVSLIKIQTDRFALPLGSAPRFVILGFAHLN